MSLEFAMKMESTLPAETEFSPTASMLCLRRAFIEELMKEEPIRRTMAASSEHVGHFPKPRPASAQPANTQDLSQNRHCRPSTAPALFHREEVELSLPGSCESFIVSSPKRCPSPRESMTCFSSDGLHTFTKTTVESHIKGVIEPGQWDVTEVEDLTPQKTVNKKNNNTASCKMVQGNSTAKTKIDSLLESSNVQEKQEVPVPCHKQKKETPVHLFYASSVHPQNSKNSSSLDKADTKTPPTQKSQTKSDSGSGKASVKNFFKGLWKKGSSKNCKSSEQKSQCPSPSSVAQGPTAHTVNVGSGRRPSCPSEGSFSSVSLGSGSDHTVTSSSDSESTVTTSEVSPPPTPPQRLPSFHLPPTPPPFSWDSPIAWLRAFYRYKKAKLLDYIYANYKTVSITIIFCIGGLIVFFCFF